MTALREYHRTTEHNKQVIRKGDITVADYITFGIDKVKVEEVSECVMKEKLTKVHRIYFVV